MLPPHDLDKMNKNYGITSNTDAVSSSAEEVNAVLAEISRILSQMLFLAELSAGDYDVNRAVLQNELEQLQRKLDGLADTI